MAVCHGSGVEAYNKQLTTVITLTGVAMLPTLNNKAASESQANQAVDSLLLRYLPRATARSVFEGDVVAFNSPLARQEQDNVLVRRIAATEGAEMVSDDYEDVPFTLPTGIPLLFVAACSLRHHCLDCGLGYASTLPLGLDIT